MKKNNKDQDAFTFVFKDKCGKKTKAGAKAVGAEKTFLSFLMAWSIVETLR